MLLNSEELLALAHGDTEPDRLADLLDRLEHCPDSAAALRVIVSLKANREEALEVLRRAAEKDATSTPIPHPAARISPSMGWATQGLRLAASIAIVAVVGMWAVSYFGVADTTALATNTYENIVGPGRPLGAEFTSDRRDVVSDAYDALEAGEFATAKRLLADAPSGDDGLVPLYLGMAHYFLNEYDQALGRFIEVRETADVSDTGIQHQAAWYEANTLLALDQPMKALDVFEELKSATDYRFQEPAMETYAALREALGMTSPR